ncbi:hypothetical protein [Streptococcus lactarius]|uniref:hypothetical protein n=1 Tax=Streptococcus lactarius TaxID=684066 RepID=UPI0036068B92
MGGNQTTEQALGISAKKLDLAKLDWKNFDGKGKSKSTAKAEDKKTGFSKSKLVYRISVFAKSPQPQLHLQE